MAETAAGPGRSEQLDGRRLAPYRLGWITSGEPMTTRANLAVDPRLVEFVETELLSGLEISADDFWEGLHGIVVDFGPRNRGLMERRDELQAKIDAWYDAHRDATFDVAAEEVFLRSIGYLTAEPTAFVIDTDNVDPEFSQT